MDKRILLIMAAVALAGVFVMPTEGVSAAAAAGGANPLVRAAARQSLANPKICKALEEGRIAPTPQAALDWKKLQELRRERHSNAAAMRQRMMTGAGAPPAQAR